MADFTPAERAYFNRLRKEIDRQTIQPDKEHRAKNGTSWFKLWKRRNG